MLARLCWLFLPALLLVSGEVTQRDSEKASAFKDRFLTFSKECASQYETTTGEVMLLLLKVDTDKTQSMCYLYCMLQKYKLMNPKGGYANENFQRFLDSMPDSKFKNSIQANAKKCAQEDSEERCVKAYKFTKCFYNQGENAPSGTQTPGT